MRVEPLGDRAYILRDLDAPAYDIANWLNLKPPAGLVEAVASYDTVGLYVEAGFEASEESLFGPAGSRERGYAAIEPQHHEIPVCYALGEDLIETAETLGLTPGQIIGAHTSLTYTCYAVGFCPGFAYLGHLPEAISGLPRRPTPRTRVEPGSVGITGTQTGVYPLPRPGGWTLIGRTPLILVDVASGFFPISAGDTVRFFPIESDEFQARQGERL